MSINLEIEGTLTVTTAQINESPTIGGKYHFLLRRLHSLCGIVPIGVFLMFHLFTNMQMAFGTFQHEVEWIHSQPALIFMEIFVLALPIGFHAVLGLAYTFRGAKNNTRQYGYWSNWRYALQRITGIIALIFIALHVFTLRGKMNIFGWYTPFFVHGELPSGGEVELAKASTAIAFQASWLVLAFYVIGVTSAVYHWSNGLWTAAVTWGITVSAGAQKRWGVVCGGVFAALMVFSAIAIFSAATYEPTADEMAAYEHEIEKMKEGQADDGHAMLIENPGE